MGKVQHYNEVTMIKAIATLFITWFHFKWTVPEALSPFFIGGAIGNSIFFFCAGYLLKFKEESFWGQWMVQKYLRVMIPVWIVYLLFIVCDLLRGYTINEGWQHWIYPTDFWFVNSILCYFLIVFATRRWIEAGRDDASCQRRNLVFLGIATLVANVLWYVFLVENKSIIVMDEGGLKCWFFFSFFLWGYYVRNYGDKVNVSKWAWMEAPLSLVMFYGYKKLAVGWMIEWQVVIVPILLANVVYAYRRLAKTLLIFEFPDSVKAVIMFLASITLEIYIVQMYLINWIMPQMVFPMNMFVSLVCIFVMAHVVHIIATWVTSKLSFLK